MSTPRPSTEHSTPTYQPGDRVLVELTGVFRSAAEVVQAVGERSYLVRTDSLCARGGIVAAAYPALAGVRILDVLPQPRQGE